MIFDVVFNQSPENMQADFGEVSVIQGPPGPPGDTTAADAAAKAAQKSAEVAQTAAQKAQAAAEASAQSAAQAAESVSVLADDLTALKTENTALKAETARTARSLDYLWKKSKEIIYDTETVTGTGSSITVPSGAMDYAALRKLGGMSQRDAENNVLIDAPVDAVRVGNAAGDSTVAYPIPQAIRDLCPDYGIGVSAACYNYIDFAAKQYHHNVGQVDLGTLAWAKTTGANKSIHRWEAKVAGIQNPATNDVNANILCSKYQTLTANATYRGTVGVSGQANTSYIYLLDMAYADADTFKAAVVGVPLYYQLATPDVIDLSAVWSDDDFGIIKVEAGGTINLHYPALDDGFELAVPSETEIMVDVAKVVQTNG